MEPIQCPDGFRTARGADHALLAAFLGAQFAAAQAAGEVACPRGVDPASVTFSPALGGCVSLPPNAGWAMAEGVVAFRCAGATKTQFLGVEADGSYQ